MPPPFLTSPELLRAGFSHAFFTRRGGVSAAPWGSLNFAVSVGDDAAAVAENMTRAAGALGIQAHRLYVLSQVHGSVARVLHGDEEAAQVARSRGDILASPEGGTGCGVRTADCVPVLLGDRASGAVAAVHSGWRGTVANAAAAGVRALIELGSAPGDLVAAIGPHIERCCFEVGSDVAETLAGSAPLGRAAIVRTSGDKAYVDLRAVVRSQLEAAGVASAAVDDVPGCTACDAERFHSYRRDHERSGRLLSAIGARGAIG